MFSWRGSAQLDRIESKLDRVLRKENIQMAQQQDIKDALDKVRADVTAQTTVIAGMSTYVAGLQKQLVDMANASKDTETASALMALASQIESNTKSDADAMAANLTGVTPAQAGTPEPAPQPAPVPVDPAPAPVFPVDPAPLGVPQPPSSQT